MLLDLLLVTLIIPITRFFYLILTFALLLILSGCATPESASTRKLVVPLVRQSEENMCGIAALEMIESFYKSPVKAKFHESLVASVNASKGTSAALLKEAFIDSGYNAVIFPGELSAGIAGLYHHIDSGHPVIVMFGAEAKRHYLVVFGYDPENHKVYFNDPLKGVVSLGSESFLKFWQMANNFSLLTFPKP